jgi:propanol-preferring alcohol dehydrogenase
MDLWEERIITSVANLTRRDGEEFFDIAPRVPVKTKTETFPLEQANTALDRFRAGELSGTAVLLTSEASRSMQSERPGSAGHSHTS